MADKNLPPEPQPETAKQAVAMVREDHRWVKAMPDINSTDGIKRNIEALWAAIDRLAAFVDGDKPTDATITPQEELDSRRPRPNLQAEPGLPA